MTKTTGRYPAEFTIANVPADIKTITASIASIQSASTSIVLKKPDQLNAASVTIKTLTQGNQTQASESPINMTVTGLEASATISVSRDIKQLIQYAFLTDYTDALTSPTTNPGLHRYSDKAGLTVGACAALPYRTVIIRPYGCGDTVSTDPETWLIFPWAFFHADAQLEFGLGTQYSYNIMFSAFPNPDPTSAAYGQDRILRGNTALLPTGSYPTPA